MLTPRFDISQDRNSLKIVIKAPCARVSDTEFYFEDTEFKFYSKPYYLRLNLPGKVLQDGREKATYDAETGTFTVVVPKECPGEHFDGLDLLTKLLAPKGAKSASTASVEVLGTDTKKEEDGEEDAEEEEEEIDWHIEQVPWWENQPQSELQPGMKYGFANRRSGVFSKLQEELQDVVDVKEPDSLTNEDCREARMEAEQKHFNPDHYLADLYEDDSIQELLKYQPPWAKELNKSRKGEVDTDDCKDHPEENVLVFTEEEKEQMLRLPKREYLLDEKVLPVVCFGLVDILFAYAYNYRTTEGEDNVESAWTICKLSSTLSWLESFSCLRETVVSSCRRSLCYPLYRSWDFAMAVLQDTRDIIATGRRGILRCLLHIHRLLSADDNKYILNDLYITDYCVWVQTAGHKVFSSLAQTLSEIKLSKADVNLELEELEHAARLVQMEEEEESTQVVEPMENLRLQVPDRCSAPTGESVAPVDEMARLSLSNSTEKSVLGNDKVKSDTVLLDSDDDSDDDSNSSTETGSSSDDESDADDKTDYRDVSKKAEVQPTSESTIGKHLQPGDVRTTSCPTSPCCKETEEKEQKHLWLEVPDVEERYKIVEEIQ